MLWACASGNRLKPAPVDADAGAFPGSCRRRTRPAFRCSKKSWNDIRGVEFYLTEKLDGTSFTAFIREGEFGVCSRNLLLDTTDPMSTLVGIAKRLNLEERLRALGAARGFEVAIQGEIIGPGVQQNKYALKEVALRVFNVFDVSAYRFLDHADVLTRWHSR